MKKLIITLSILMGWTIASYAQTGTVILHVTGVDLKRGGELSAGIFKEEHFPKVGKQLKGQELTVTAEVMEIRLNNIPIGSYGAVVFQDIDLDKDLKTNFVGLPREPIGFSNDAQIRFGPPAFNDARFIVEKNKETIIKITLK